ncbi:FAD-dependent oxidoreductase [bacterium]|jgi:ferredoxin-NADP reductase|nr:FAD-dependent oxidoreductase [bacterium]MBT6831598.1 FAD-dependent oxidoreductase [bacterium]MBT6995893.1 FAD-dependent oxidoreductase [bacterium]MBT7772667.1 FAD-dependent oxidoreductase [bacterium]
MKIWEGNLELKSVEIVAHETKKFRFVRPAEFEFEAGQFVSMRFDVGNFSAEKKSTVWRAYSIASESSEKNFLEFIVRIIPGGIASGVFDAAVPGTKIWTKGGFGNFVRSENSDAELIFCATGTGIAPLRSMIREELLEKNPRKMKLFFGGREPADLAYLDEFFAEKKVATKFGFSRSDDFGKFAEIASHCRITSFLETENFGKTAEFYVCGNGSMVLETVEFLKEKMPGTKIFHERFT